MALPWVRALCLWRSHIRRWPLIAAAFVVLLAAGQSGDPGPGTESVAAPVVFPQAGRQRERVTEGGFKLPRAPWNCLECEQSVASRLVPQIHTTSGHLFASPAADLRDADLGRHAACTKCRHAFCGNYTWQVSGRFAPRSLARPRFFADDEAAPDGHATHSTEHNEDCQSQTTRGMNGNKPTDHPLASWQNQLPELRARYTRDGYVVVSGLIEEPARAEAEQVVVSNLF